MDYVGRDDRKPLSRSTSAITTAGTETLVAFASGERGYVEGFWVSIVTPANGLHKVTLQTATGAVPLAVVNVPLSNFVNVWIPVFYLAAEGVDIQAVVAGAGVVNVSITTLYRTYNTDAIVH